MPAARRQLSQERIMDATVQLVDREGLAALTMRRLGRELGVEGMALYSYFSNHR
jgi:AcrR family transcriptional regulator